MAKSKGRNRFAPARIAAYTLKNATKRPQNTITQPYRTKRYAAERKLSAVDPDEVPVLEQQSSTKSAASPKTEIVAQNCATGCGTNDEPNIQPVLGACVDGCANKNGLASQREAQTINHNNSDNDH